MKRRASGSSPHLWPLRRPVKHDRVRCRAQPCQGRPQKLSRRAPATPTPSWKHAAFLLPPSRGRPAKAIPNPRRHRGSRTWGDQTTMVVFALALLPSHADGGRPSDVDPSLGPFQGRCQAATPGLAPGNAAGRLPRRRTTSPGRRGPSTGRGDFTLKRCQPPPATNGTVPAARTRRGVRAGVAHRPEPVVAWVPVVTRVGGVGLESDLVPGARARPANASVHDRRRLARFRDRGRRP